MKFEDCRLKNLKNQSNYWFEYKINLIVVVKNKLNNFFGFISFLFQKSLQNYKINLLITFFQNIFNTFLTNITQDWSTLIKKWFKIINKDRFTIDQNLVSRFSS